MFDPQGFRAVKQGWGVNQYGVEVQGDVSLFPDLWSLLQVSNIR